MAASMKDIKLRIHSVEGTRQITKAMELVASSKLRRAKERAERSRPYFNTLYEAITDGQIFLESELFNAGVMPAVNPGISVSRVGGDAQIKAMKKVAGSLKLLYSQYRELQSFAQFGSDLDADTKARLALGERIVAVLKQKNNAPVEVAHQVCIIYAVTHGYLNDLDVDVIPAFEARLCEFMENNHSDVLSAIRTTGKLEKDTEEALKAALNDLLVEFK